MKENHKLDEEYRKWKKIWSPSSHRNELYFLHQLITIFNTSKSPCPQLESPQEIYKIQSKLMQQIKSCSFLLPFN